MTVALDCVKRRAACSTLGLAKAEDAADANASDGRANVEEFCGRDARRGAAHLPVRRRQQPGRLHRKRPDRGELHPGAHPDRGGHRRLRAAVRLRADHGRRRRGCHRGRLFPGGLRTAAVRTGPHDFRLRVRAHARQHASPARRGRRIRRPTARCNWATTTTQATSAGRHRLAGWGWPNDVGMFDDTDGSCITQVEDDLTTTETTSICRPSNAATSWPSCVPPVKSSPCPSSTASGEADRAPATTCTGWPHSSSPDTRCPDFMRLPR